jgi:hypothetical protein
MLVTAGTPANSRDDGCKGIPATARRPNTMQKGCQQQQRYNKNMSACNSRDIRSSHCQLIQTQGRKRSFWSLSLCGWGEHFSGPLLILKESKHFEVSKISVFSISRHKRLSHASFYNLQNEWSTLSFCKLV